jgi:hypothetical protein
MNLALLTSYFSKKIHPNDPKDNAVVGRNLDGHVSNNEINYIKPWYDSVNKLQLNGFVFHDNLSDQFVEQYTTNKIKFIKVGDFEYSNNDYRFFCFRDFLQENKFDVVFHNDASDVTVVKDPIDLIKQNPTIDYFACQDSIKLNQFPYLKAHQEFNFEDLVLFMINYDSWDLINMGVVGGIYNNMLKFYDKFCEIRESMKNPQFNADMWILQYLLRSQLQPCKFIMGEPVCSEFKQHQNERKDVFFIHK